MDAVVVDDDKTARDCVQYMKEQRIGTATFLPIESLKTKPINEKLRELPGAKLVVDLLRFDASVQNAVTFVVGNTLVAESLNDARRLAFNQVFQCVFLYRNLVFTMHFRLTDIEWLPPREC